MISLNYLVEDMCEPLADDMQVNDVSMDSRSVSAGSVFIASAKQPEMRQQHIDQAIAAGAAAVIIDAAQTAESKVMLLKIADLDQNISAIGDRFYGQPSQAMTVIAVTGTNGKTSVSQFIARSLELLARPCGIIGTLGQGRLNDLKDTGMTTPNPLQLQQALAAMRDEGLQYVVLEASSHALQQGRLNAVAIDIAVFTNLSRDHLDYHGDMQRYEAAKQQLFRLPSVQTAVINMDDPAGQRIYLQQRTNLNCLTCSQQQAADWQAKMLQCDSEGLHFQLQGSGTAVHIDSVLLGRFNVDNLLATAAVLNAVNIDMTAITRCLTQLTAVTGRMQLVKQHNSPAVVVDYAHTPDALSQALSAMRQHLDQSAALWCVFGCGGDRDTGKRPLMGAQAEQLASHLVITDDNPRNETSESIINDILSGLKQPADAVILADRRHAIFYAVNEAANDDMVLVAGKGHENYQEKQGSKQPFNDVAIVEQALSLRQQQAGANL